MSVNRRVSSPRLIVYAILSLAILHEVFPPRFSCQRLSTLTMPHDIAISRYFTMTIFRDILRARLSLIPIAMSCPQKLLSAFNLLLKKLRGPSIGDSRPVPLDCSCPRKTPLCLGSAVKKTPGTFYWRFQTRPFGIPMPSKTPLCLQSAVKKTPSQVA